MAMFVAMLMPMSAFAGDDTPFIGKALGRHCVIPIKEGDERNFEMRKNHMKYLLEKRDETMHKGVRTDDFSFKACVACHTRVENGMPAKVNAPGQFCAGCHAAAAVTLDCFECHAAVPAKDNALLQEYLKSQH